MSTITIYTDGAARGNPGKAGAGAMIEITRYSLPVTRYSFKSYLGVATNNQAEYRALIMALEEAIKIIQKTRLEAPELLCYSDSKLMVSQMKGEYRVKNKDLQTLFLRAIQLTETLPRVSFIHIPREKNKEADALANEAIDEKYAAIV